MEEISVIVVDDEEALRKMYSRVLRDERYRLHVVETPDQVLSLMEASPTAVLVTDNQMPSMNGNDLCKIVMERYPLTTRIMMSAAKQPEVFNGHYFLTKPFGNGEVKEKVLKGIEDHLQRLQEKTNP